MATSLITDEAELGSLADFLDTKTTALFLTKENFLIHDTNIVHFSKHFLEANMGNNPATIRDDLEFYWWLAVRKAFKTGDPDQERLLRQASTFTTQLCWPRTDVVKTKCPHFQDFVDNIQHGSREFEKRMKEKKEIQNIMHLWPRNLAVHTKVKDSSDIFIRSTYGNVLVPEIYLKSIQDVHFLDLGTKVSEANPNVVISYCRFTILWRIVIEKVYDYQNRYETSKKIEEGLTVNHLDFELAVGNIEIREYHERSAQRHTHFNGPPNEICSTGFDKDASGKIDKAAEPEASRSKKKKRRRRCKKTNTNPTEAGEKIANEHRALLDLGNSTPTE